MITHDFSPNFMECAGFKIAHRHITAENLPDANKSAIYELALHLGEGF